MGLCFCEIYIGPMKITSIALIISSFFCLDAFAKKKAVISGYDVLALPGERIDISVKAEKAKIFPFRTDLKKQNIRFFLGDKYLGKAKTKEEGLAKLSYRFDRPGLYLVKSMIGPNSKYKATPTDNRVLVARADQRIMITDIDHTIADISGTDYLITPDELIPELPLAGSTLRKLKDKFQIVYLTARDDLFIKRSKFWLDFMKFPKGPSFFWDFGFWNGVPTNHGEYKEAQIRKLKLKHKKILIGVGDKPHDMVAYRKNGLRAYYLGKPTSYLIKGTISVNSWAELEKHLALNPIGTLPEDPNP